MKTKYEAVARLDLPNETKENLLRLVSDEGGYYATITEALHNQEIAAGPPFPMPDGQSETVIPKLIRFGLHGLVYYPGQVLAYHFALRATGVFSEIINPGSDQIALTFKKNRRKYLRAVASLGLKEVGYFTTRQYATKLGSVDGYRLTYSSTDYSRNVVSPATASVGTKFQFLEWLLTSDRHDPTTIEDPLLQRHTQETVGVVKELREHGIIAHFQPFVAPQLEAKK